MTSLKALPALLLVLFFPGLLMAADLTMMVIDGDSYIANLDIERNIYFLKVPLYETTLKPIDIYVVSLLLDQPSISCPGRSKQS